MDQWTNENLKKKLLKIFKDDSCPQILAVLSKALCKGNVLRIQLPSKLISVCLFQCAGLM